MALEPISPTLQAQYRDTLNVNSSPSMIDSNVVPIPVAVVAQVFSVDSASYTYITDGTDTAGVETDGRLRVNVYPTPGTLQTIVMKANGKAGTSITSGTGVLVHTTTGGKKFYVTSMHLGVVGATNPTFDIRDGTTIGGTVVWSGGSLLGASQPGPIIVPFVTPLKLSTGLFLDTGNGGSHTIVYSFTGYEE